MNKLRDELTEAIAAENIPAVRRLLEDHPEQINLDPGHGSWLTFAAGCDSVEMIECLIGLGADPNLPPQNVTGTVPLGEALMDNRLDNARTLLRHGADPNFRRIILTAVSGGLGCVKLLVEFGADIHREFTNDYTGEPMNALSFALSYGQQDVADYLLSLGAMLPGKNKAVDSATAQSLEDQVIHYMAQRHGPVDQRSLVEIVPDEAPVSIRITKPTKEHPYVCVFTVGCSHHKMNVPAGEGENARAELTIQLPPSWKLDIKSLADDKWGWPVEWLRWLAKYPRQQNTWLGGRIAVASREQPPHPFVPGREFSSMLLMADEQLSLDGGEFVNIYRMMPIHEAERQLEQEQGVMALMEALESVQASFTFDPDRPCSVG